MKRKATMSKTPSETAARHQTHITFKWGILSTRLAGVVHCHLHSFSITPCSKIACGDNFPPVWESAARGLQGSKTSHPACPHRNVPDGTSRVTPDIWLCSISRCDDLITRKGECRRTFGMQSVLPLWTRLNGKKWETGSHRPVLPSSRLNFIIIKHY